MDRPGNNPKRRIARAGLLNDRQRTELARSVKYVASGHHKRNPCGLRSPKDEPETDQVAVRCQARRTLTEAKALIRKGILAGMMSDFFFGRYPKFIWCVAEEEEVYEARTDHVTPGVYHGYRLEEDDDMRDYIKKVWKQRCQQVGP